MACQHESRKVRLQGLSVRLPRSRGRRAPSPMEALRRPGRLRAMFRRAPSMEGPFPLNDRGLFHRATFLLRSRKPLWMQNDITPFPVCDLSGHIFLPLALLRSPRLPREVSPELSAASPLRVLAQASRRLSPREPVVDGRQAPPPSAVRVATSPGDPFSPGSLPHALPSAREGRYVREGVIRSRRLPSPPPGKGLLSFGATFLSRICA